MGGRHYGRVSVGKRIAEHLFGFYFLLYECLVLPQPMSMFL